MYILILTYFLNSSTSMELHQITFNDLGACVAAGKTQLEEVRDLNKSNNNVNYVGAVYQCAPVEKGTKS